MFFMNTDYGSCSDVSDNHSYVCAYGAELAQLVRWMTLNQEVPSSSLDTAI